LGHKFSLVLSREITDAESAVLQEAGFSGASFATDSLPTNAEVTVTKVDFDDTVSPSLAEAIESALEAVKKVPDLSVPGLTVPAVPVEKADEKPGTVTGEVIEQESDAEPVTAEKAATGNGSAKKTGNGRTSARKTSAKKATADEADSAGANGSTATTTSSD
jgi:hypothetical protein